MKIKIIIIYKRHKSHVIVFYKICSFQNFFFFFYIFIWIIQSIQITYRRRVEIADHNSERFFTPKLKSMKLRVVLGIKKVKNLKCWLGTLRFFEKYFSNNRFLRQCVLVIHKKLCSQDFGLKLKLAVFCLFFSGSFIADGWVRSVGTQFIVRYVCFCVSCIVEIENACVLEDGKTVCWLECFQSVLRCIFAIVVNNADFVENESLLRPQISLFVLLNFIFSEGHISCCNEYNGFDSNIIVLWWLRFGSSRLC